MEFRVTDSDRLKWAQSIEESFSSGKSLSTDEKAKVLKEFIPNKGMINPSEYLGAIKEGIDSGKIDTDKAKKILTALEIPTPGIFSRKTPLERLSSIVNVGIQASKLASAPPSKRAPIQASAQKRSFSFMSLFRKKVVEPQVSPMKQKDENIKAFTQVLQSLIQSTEDMANSETLKDSISSTAQKAWDYLPRGITDGHLPLLEKHKHAIIKSALVEILKDQTPKTHHKPLGVLMHKALHDGLEKYPNNPEAAIKYSHMEGKMGLAALLSKSLPTNYTVSYNDNEDRMVYQMGSPPRELPNPVYFSSVTDATGANISAVINHDGTILQKIEGLEDSDISTSELQAYKLFEHMLATGSTPGERKAAVKGLAQSLRIEERSESQLKMDVALRLISSNDFQRRFLSNPPSSATDRSIKAILDSKDRIALQLLSEGVNQLAEGEDIDIGAINDTFQRVHLALSSDGIKMSKAVSEAKKKLLQLDLHNATHQSSLHPDQLLDKAIDTFLATPPIASESYESVTRIVAGSLGLEIPRAASPLEIKKAIAIAYSNQIQGRDSFPSESARDMAYNNLFKLIEAPFTVEVHQMKRKILDPECKGYKSVKTWMEKSGNQLYETFRFALNSKQSIGLPFSTQELETAHTLFETQPLVDIIQYSPSKKDAKKSYGYHFATDSALKGMQDSDKKMYRNLALQHKLNAFESIERLQGGERVDITKSKILKKVYREALSSSLSLIRSSILTPWSREDRALARKLYHKPPAEARYYRDISTWMHTIGSSAFNSLDAAREALEDADISHPGLPLTDSEASNIADAKMLANWNLRREMFDTPVTVEIEGVNTEMLAHDEGIPKSIELPIDFRGKVDDLSELASNIFGSTDLHEKNLLSWLESEIYEVSKRNRVTYGNLEQTLTNLAKRFQLPAEQVPSIITNIRRGLEHEEGLHTRDGTSFNFTNALVRHMYKNGLAPEASIPDLRGFLIDEHSNNAALTSSEALNGLQNLINIVEFRETNHAYKFSDEDKIQIANDLKLILYMLPKIPREDQPRVLGSLMVAAVHCPTGNRTTLSELKEHMQAQILKREASTDPSTNMRRAVATKLQQVRTNILLQNVDSTNREQVHGVNYYLNLIGREVGAKGAPPYVYMDPYFDNHSGANLLSREEARDQFQLAYTRNAIIEEAHKEISSMSDGKFHEAIPDIFGEDGYDVFDSSFTRSKEITEQMLMHWGYIETPSLSSNQTKEIKAHVASKSSEIAPYDLQQHIKETYGLLCPIGTVKGFLTAEG